MYLILERPCQHLLLRLKRTAWQQFSDICFLKACHFNQSENVKIFCLISFAEVLQLLFYCNFIRISFITEALHRACGRVVDSKRPYLSTEGKGWVEHSGLISHVS